VEALETVPLLAKALSNAGIDAPVTNALARLIQSELPLEEWVAVVRTTIPTAPRRRGPIPPSLWRRFVGWIRRVFSRRKTDA
jgi:glycerol-3-phosphate dehydrogenase (NAD(P)+)